MGQAVQQGSGEPLAAQYLGPILKGQVGSDDQAGLLISPTYHLEEQFRSGLTEGNIA